MKLKRRGEKEYLWSLTIPKSSKCKEPTSSLCRWGHGSTTTTQMEDANHRPLRWPLRPGWARGRICHTDELFMNDNALMCQLFPTIFQGVVFHWHTRFPRNSIDSFMTLIMHFGPQYVTSRPHHFTIVALVNIQQEEDEPLHNFMKRFSLVSTQI